MTLGDKTLAVLRFAAIEDTTERHAAMQAACEKWSHKAIERKCEQLAAKGWVDYGVAAIYCWITPEGKKALEAP